MDASHNDLIDMSDACARAGTMCAFLAARGRCGMFGSHVCVDLMSFPSGSEIHSGLLVGWMFVAGAFGMRKWPVAPVSAIPVFGSICIKLLANACTGCCFVLQLLVMMVSSSSLQVTNAALCVLQLGVLGRSCLDVSY